MKSKKIMISYNSSDEMYARKVYRFISGLGYDVWMAPDDIDQGGNYEEQIINAIEKCSIVIVIVSKKTYESKHVLSEIRTAFNNKKKFIVLRLDFSEYSKSFDYFLGDEQWINFRDVKENYTQLADALIKKQKPPAAKKGIVIVAVLILAACFAVACFLYFFNRVYYDTNRTKTESESKTELRTETNTENKTEPETATEIETKDSLDYIGAKEADYGKCLTANDYFVIYDDTGNYSFAYPKDFFQTGEHSEDGYSFIAGDEFTSLKLERTELEEDALDYIRKVYKKEKSKLVIDTDANGVAVISDEINGQGWARCVVGGVWKDDSSKGSYSIIASDGSYVYSMKFQYYVLEENEDGYYNKQNYMIDCLYRYCSFSGSSYDPRSFSDFLNDRKQVE